MAESGKMAALPVPRVVGIAATTEKTLRPASLPPSHFEMCDRNLSLS